MKKNKLTSLMVAIFLLSIFSADLSAQDKLKDVFKDYFLIGAALNRDQIFEKDLPAAKIVNEQFNTISPENILKWGEVHPQPDRYNFEAADRYVDFGSRNGMFVVGHNLVWHNQTPKWVFQDKKGNLVSRDELLKRLREHIETVVGRYKGKIKGWDVVNEALNDDGSLRQTPWLKIIGEDYLAKAFEYAHRADPAAELYYNDYSLENEPKRRGAIALIKKLLAQGIPITAVGLQGHNNLTFPTVEQQDATLSEFAALGIKIAITELDVSVLPDPEGFSGAEVSLSFEMKEKLNPYKNGLPAEIQKKLADRYAELFAVYLKHHQDIDRITFWNVTDKESWLNNFPVRGRINHPLLFDRQGKPKPAFNAVIESVKADRRK
ncbi:MAG TPA: endo-1,4-beta-xylanase [Pyrinomonadaceae bacterium]|nr:endo-1,4-beta-xylanase [Pyrinomonadaceae bacterium]